MNKTEKKNHYFWNLQSNSFLNVEKNLFNCAIIMTIGTKTSSFHFLTPGREILFAEFKKLKVSNEFAEKCLNKRQKAFKTSQPRSVMINTKTFNKEDLMNFLLSARGGSSESNDAFDKFVCLWL